MGVRQLQNPPRTPDESIRPADGERTKWRAVLDLLWSDWRIGVLAAIALAAGFALISAWLTPRGPITTSEALISIGAALAIGIAAGLAMGSRWSILITPVVFAFVFEFARLGVEGPTVDAINLSGMYGIFALVLGRGVHGLLVLAPLALGSVFGVSLAGRLGNTTSATMGGLGWTLTGVTSLAIAAMAFSPPFRRRPHQSSVPTGSPRREVSPS